MAVIRRSFNSEQLILTLFKKPNFEGIIEFMLDYANRNDIDLIKTIEDFSINKK
jgi:hypothetical protein